jgi:hypothetical protein
VKRARVVDFENIILKELKSRANKRRFLRNESGEGAWDCQSSSEPKERKRHQCQVIVVFGALGDGHRQSQKKKRRRTSKGEKGEVGNMTLMAIFIYMFGIICFSS